MNRIIRFLSIALVAILSQSMSCGNEPVMALKNLKFVKGTITLRYVNRNISDETLYAVGSAMETYGDASLVTDGYDGYLLFSTNLYDEETIIEASKAGSYWSEMTLVTSNHYDFSFKLRSGAISEGKSIKIGSIYWYYENWSIDLLGDYSGQYGGTVTVKSITKDKVTLRFDDVKFESMTRFIPGESEYEYLIINGEISFSQPS